MVWMWSYHWLSRYPFLSVSLWEWTYVNPQHTSRYCCNTCSKGGFLPFLSPHPTRNGYFYYQNWLWWTMSLLIWFAQIWYNEHRQWQYMQRVMMVAQDMILYRMNIRWWLHSFYYWNVWVFPFSFWFFFNHLCIDHYHVSSMVMFSPLDVHFQLLTMCVQSPRTFAGHNDFLVGCCTWSRFIIFSTYHS